MDAIGYHETPLGRVLLAADSEGLVASRSKIFCGAGAGVYAAAAFLGTPFQQAVWRALLKIPYRLMAIWRMKWLQIVHCHRVVGADGSLTGGRRS